MAVVLTPPGSDSATDQRDERTRAFARRAVRKHRRALEMLVAYDRGELDVKPREHMPRRRD